MISSLFINATIVISFLYLGSQIFKNESLLESTTNKNKILLGIFCGLAGCLLILYSIQTYNKVLIDLRVISVMIAAFYGGFVSSIIATFIIALFRVGYFGLSYISVIASTSLIMVALIFSYISKSRFSFIKKFIIMSVINIIYGIVLYSVLINDSKIISLINFSFTISTIIVSIIVYYTLKYISKTNELYRKLRFESTKDYLTGLNNVREFDKLLNKHIHSAVEKNENISILMIDIDYFKNINDTYGHSSGDLILKQLSNLLVKSCRSFDVVSRNGGEEFTTILLDCDYEHAFNIAERMRKAVEEYAFIIEGNKEINITVSIGVGTYPYPIQEINTILKVADDALYNAKRSGRNKVC
ncbi:GGDEF domain-containing protein [Clostridium sp. 'White wine YQ']|uniref:GGDEF domain-containing protein n=1 Tax=Clostridium sp. 'White wine YQ' TaxID=3027474 RepID=UPI002366BC5D|nr:diguanylate cyclase [Clostridium sp. 'White wine YQ']MDD7793727.1 diguanylate cyclase [Clostridium sp. 'White wine YQ']